MFELTNDQRKCFALEPIHDQWVCIEAKPSPYDQFKTYLYLDGDTIVKCILSGDSQYCEYELSEKVSPDRKYLLPKTTKGNPTLLSSSTILDIVVRLTKIAIVKKITGNAVPIASIHSASDLIFA